MDERLENIKKCAEERSELSLSCLNKIDLSKMKKQGDIASSRYHYDKCVMENSINFPCLAEKNKRLNKSHVY